MKAHYSLAEPQPPLLENGESNSPTQWALVICAMFGPNLVMGGECLLSGGSFPRDLPGRWGEKIRLNLTWWGLPTLYVCSSARPVLCQLSPSPCRHVHALGVLWSLLGRGLEHRAKELWSRKWRKTCVLAWHSCESLRKWLFLSKPQAPQL